MSREVISRHSCTYPYANRAPFALWGSVCSVYNVCNACNVFNVIYAKGIHHVMFTTYAIYGIRVVIAIFVMSAAYGLYVTCSPCPRNVS